MTDNEVAAKAGHTMRLATVLSLMAALAPYPELLAPKPNPPKAANP